MLFCDLRYMLLHIKVFHIKHATRGEWGGPPTLSWKSKKCPGFGEKGPDFVHPEVRFTIENIVWRVSRTKSSNIFCCRTFYPWFFEEMFVYWSALISRNLPCPEQSLVVQLHIYDISNLIFVHWNCIDCIYRNLGGLVVWYLKRWPGFDFQPGSILSTVNYLKLMIYF